MVQPKKYQEYATQVAEDLLPRAVENRLVKVGDKWKAPHFLLSSKELIAVRQGFRNQPIDDDLVQLLGKAFSRTCPTVHYEFVSDGFVLGLGGNRERQTVIVRELPPCHHSYEDRPRVYQAAYDAVAALINFRLAGARNWWRDFIGENEGGSDLIYGTLYQMIRTIGEFSYCRTRNVIWFIYASVPELYSEWQAEGLELKPVYHAESTGRRFTSLRLMPKSPA